MNGKIPVDVNFDQGPARAWVELTSLFDQIPNPQEYFIIPSVTRDVENDKWKVYGYSFVHASNLPNYEDLKSFYGE